MMPSHSRGAGVPGVAVIELTVRNGQTPLPRVAYQAGLPPTRSTMGSGGDVEWPLSAPGVEPRHAEFAWDGQALWVRDAGSQRGTFVNGARIGTDWVPVQPGQQIVLGQAVIVASGSAAAAQSAPAASGRNDFDDDQPTQMVSEALVPSGPLPKAPTTASGPGEQGLSERTVIVQSPFDESNGRAGALPPKAGFSTTDPRGAPPGGAVPLPRIGARQQTGSSLPVAPSTAPDNAEATVAFSIPDDRPPPAPTFNANAAPSAAPPFGASSSFAPANPMGGPPPGFPPMPPSSAMAAPNPGAGGGSLPSIFGSIPPPPPEAAPAAKPVFTLPKRTLIMIGATLAVAVGVLLLNPRAPVHPVATTVQPHPPVDPQTTVVRPNLTPPVVGPPAGPTGLLLSATTGPLPPPPPDPHVRRPPDPPAPPIDTVPERIAANTVAQGRFRDAVTLYDQLAAAHPDSPVYAQIATILRRKIEAQTQCVPGSSTQCAVTPTAAPAAHP